MELEIGGIKRELRFGTGFIRKLDEINKVNMNGIEFGVGLIIANTQLQQMNPAGLSTIIRCAAKGNLKEREVDNFLDDYADENGGLKELFDEVSNELGKSTVIKDTLDKLKQVQKVAEVD